MEFECHVGPRIRLLDLAFAAQYSNNLINKLRRHQATCWPPTEILRILRMARGGGAGRGPPTRETQVSKKLSWLLRHNAEKEGLKLGPGGYINLKDVVGVSCFFPLHLAFICHVLVSLFSSTCVSRLHRKESVKHFLDPLGSKNYANNNDIQSYP